MQERVYEYHIHPAVEVLPTCRRVQHVFCEKRRLQRIAIAEEIVAKADEFTLHICAVNVLRRRPIDHKLSNILTETAADVQQFLPFFEILEYLGVEWMGAEVQAEKAKLSDTWVREYFKRFVLLSNDKKFVHVSWFRALANYTKMPYDLTCSTTCGST